MKNSSLLSLFVLAAASPLAAAATWWSSRSRVSCGSNDGRYGIYAANSTYEANLHRLAAVLPAEAASASRRRHASRAFGYWPNRLRATWSCRSSDGGDCASCIADAFKRVQRQCPFYREAFFRGANCTLRLGEYSIFESDIFGRNTMTQILVMVMMFQAFGLACIFFLFLQAWRHDIRKVNITRYTTILSGDQ